jgi:hypothetical protein
MGMARGGGGQTSHAAPPPLKAHSAAALRLVKQARSRIGQIFQPDEETRCAHFVRDVFARAGVPVGNAAHPSDRRLLPHPHDLSPGHADSLAGDGAVVHGSTVARPVGIDSLDIVRIGEVRPSNADKAKVAPPPLLVAGKRAPRTG